MDWMIDGFFAYGLRFRENKERIEQFGLTEHKCPKCGKLYSRTAQHAWKDGTNSKVVYFCSYHCMREAQKEREEKARQKKETAIKRDMDIVAREHCAGLTPEDERKIKNAKLRLEYALQQKGFGL